jgi:microcin C transport system substrate-binding protein
MQAFAFNTRRDKFRDPRVRLAFNYAFDFEEMNRQIFYAQYKRITSYFEGTDLASSGLPTDRELELLETVRDKVPPEVFTKAYSNPVGGNPATVRKNLLEATRLLRDAGYSIHDQLLVDSKSGEPFAVEFLSSYPILERVFLFYKPSLERLGITVSVRTVDEAQYENRLRSWDFDVVTYAWGEARLPGSELRDYWGSEAAAQPGSRNVIGIENPAVDALIRLVLLAKHYDNLVAAVRALDRVLLWNHYVVPQWSYNKLRVARWDRFTHPYPLPKYGISGFPSLWWWDADKAARVRDRR